MNMSFCVCKCSPVTVMTKDRDAEKEKDAKQACVLFIPVTWDMMVFSHCHSSAN